MIEIEEIEELYSREKEEAKEILTDENSKASHAQKEKEYKSKLKSAREKYYRLTENYLAKLGSKRKAKQFPKRKKTKPYVAPTKTPQLSKKEKLKLSIDITRFRIKLKLRKIREALIAPWLLYLITLFKIKVHTISSAISRRKDFIISKLKETFRSSINFIAKIIDKLKQKSIKIISWIGQKLKIVLDKIIAFKKARQEKAKEKKAKKELAAQEKKASQTQDSAVPSEQAPTQDQSVENNQAEKKEE